MAKKPIAPSVKKKLYRTIASFAILAVMSAVVNPLLILPVIIFAIPTCILTYKSAEKKRKLQEEERKRMEAAKVPVPTQVPTTIRIPSGINGMGFLHFDFNNKYVIFDTSSASSGLLLDANKKVNFSEITGLELTAPSVLTGGQVIFIINNIRYMRSGVCQFLFNVDKLHYLQLKMAVETLSNELGLVIKEKGECPAVVKEYAGEYIITSDNPDNICVKNIEYRKRCTVSGHIFCYNEEDLKKNRSNATSAALSGIGSIAGALGGAYAASAVNSANADRSLSKIVDYNRCPKCNSTKLTMLSEEEFKAISAQNNAVQQPAVSSSADELRKYKELLDMGAISQEEFDTKKKQLLGL